MQCTYKHVADTRTHTGLVTCTPGSESIQRPSKIKACGFKHVRRKNPKPKCFPQKSITVVVGANASCVTEQAEYCEDVKITMWCVRADAGENTANEYQFINMVKKNVMIAGLARLLPVFHDLLMVLVGAVGRFPFQHAS